MRLLCSLSMRQGIVQVTHFPGCIQPTEGTHTPRLRLPLCLGRGPQSMHVAPACPPACCCCHTCPRVAMLLSPRAAAAAPAALTPPTAAVRMRLCMQVGPPCRHVGTTSVYAHFPHARGDHLRLGPLPTWSCNTCNIKHLLQHTSETNETFTNICLQHMCMATTTYSIT
jgi:hypothetical protein